MRTGYFESNSTVTFAETGPPYWTTASSDDTTVLVFYSVRRAGSGANDKAPANDELVVELPTDALVADAILSIKSGRYQRGGAMLTFASTTLEGTIKLGEVGDRIRGSVDLKAVAPMVDVLEVGETRAQFAFEINRK